MIQEEVYQAVSERGYLDKSKWSKDQLIVRQVVKLIEEIGEAAGHVYGEEFSVLNGLLGNAIKVGRIAKIAFDQDPFYEIAADKALLLGELADIQVVVFVLAEFLDADIVELAKKKACSDIPRGVTC